MLSQCTQFTTADEGNSGPEGVESTVRSKMRGSWKLCISSSLVNWNTNFASLLFTIMVRLGGGVKLEAEASPPSLVIILSGQAGNVADPWLTPYGSLPWLFELYLFFYQVHTHKCLGINGLWSVILPSDICICVKCRISIFTLLWAFGAIRFS